MDDDVDRLDSELVSWRSDRAQAERNELRERGVDVGRHSVDERATLEWLSLRSPSALVAGFAVQVSRSSVFPWLKLLRIEGLQARSLEPLGDRAGGLLAAIVSSSKTVLRLNVSLFESDPAARDRIARLLVGAGFEATYPRSYVETLLLDLSRDISAIYSKLSTSTRRNIREAEKAGVLVKRERQISSTALLSEMLRASFRRHNAVSDQSIKLVETLASDPDACLLVAYWGPPHAEKRPVAFALFRRFGDVAVYDIAGSYRTPEMGRLPVMFPVLWQGIIWAREAGCTLFDFGGVAPEDDQQDPRIGISRFKEGFGGTRALVGGEWRHSSTSWLAKLISLVRRIRVSKKKGT